MNGDKIHLEIPVIITTIAKYYNMLTDEVKSERRNKEFIKAKHIAMYFSRQFTDLSFREIGMSFNNKDHATVFHAIGSVGGQKEIYSAYRNEIEQIEKELKSHALYDKDFAEYEHYETDNI